MEKGKDMRERVRRNFGAPNPEGYRKALRLMEQAEKFHRPVVCFVDTSGAFCGMGAEERGQGQAIAENLTTMAGLKTPIISVLIGEGGSGGALALALSDRVWILENAVYSVISPEGCASILWKDSKKVKDAAESLRLTAQDMLELGVVEQVIPEEKEFSLTYAKLQEELEAALSPAGPAAGGRAAGAALPAVPQILTEQKARLFPASLFSPFPERSGHYANHLHPLPRLPEVRGLPAAKFRVSPPACLEAGPLPKAAGQVWESLPHFGMERPYHYRNKVQGGLCL